MSINLKDTVQIIRGKKTDIVARPREARQYDVVEEIDYFVSSYKNSLDKCIG